MDRQSLELDNSGMETTYLADSCSIDGFAPYTLSLIDDLLFDITVRGFTSVKPFSPRLLRRPEHAAVHFGRHQHQRQRLPASVDRCSPQYLLGFEC